MSATPFASEAALHQAFAQGLEDMLARHGGLGVYVLGLANAAYDAALWEHLRAPLQALHQRHEAAIREALRHGRRVAEPEDDLLVFLKLMAIGFEHIAPTAWRDAGPWRIQFNPIRALRPPRASGGTVEGLLRPFDAAGFHFNKPFLAREVLWSGELAGKPARLLYNKFPFAPLHGLLVPEPERCLPQWLTPELHGWAWAVATAAGEGLPDLGIAYNSLGAQASVNHLHFQSFTRADALPLLSPTFRHNGGTLDYPLPCLVAEEATEAWLILDELHQAGTPYNLVYTRERVHILPRRAQGSLPLPAWSAGLAWSELAGAMTVFSREDFDALAEPEIAATLSALAP
ncbi:MAG: hypothetical protein AB1831_13750 [Pseudomonadota bacterium]